MTVFQVVHKQRWLAQEIRNVLYYETITGNPSISEWQDIVDEIRSDFDTENIMFVDTWEFYGIDYRQVDVAGLPSFSVVPTAGVLVGGDTQDSVPTQIAALVSAKANSVKPNRVRSYYAGMSENRVEDGLWSGGIFASLEGFFDDQTVLNAAGTNELQRVSVQWNSSHTMVVDYNNVAAAAGVLSPVPATQCRR